MQPYYARDGATMFICPNVKITIKKEGLLPYGFLFCSIGTTLDQIQPFIDMTATLSKAEIEELKKHISAQPIKNELSPLLVDSRECAELYAKSLTLKESFEKLTNQLTLGQLRDATKNTINDVKLLESANLALVLGLKEETLPSLFSSGMTLGYAVGLTSEKAIESLCKGIARQSRLILDNIGITFTMQQAYDWFKKEFNVDKLDATQKRDAWRQYAIKLVIEKGSSLTVNQKQIAVDQKRARIQNMKADFGKGL